jgi:hypothetical protein
MSTGQPQPEETEGRVAPPSGGAPCLLHLKKDSCIRPHRLKQAFVAQENIRLYIEKFGENNVGLLTTTTPSECLRASAFQEKWHSFLTNVLRELFPTGMWVRERQPRSGNWHSHAPVNVGWDIKTGFPFDQVQAGFYANVDGRLRALWKELRERGEACGFGRIELLPLKHSGAACARYLTKYLSKSYSTEKSEGEEKCRLFGVWGGVRFVHSQFSFVSSRILRRKKAWLADRLNIMDYDEFKQLYGPHWWHFLGPALREVILPEDEYKVLVDGKLVWDTLGALAYAEDITCFSGSEEDRMLQSHFYVFYALGKLLFGRHETKQANDFASGMVGAVKMMGTSPDETPMARQLTLQLGKSLPFVGMPSASLARSPRLSPHAD